MEFWRRFSFCLVQKRKKNVENTRNSKKNFVKKKFIFCSFCDCLRGNVGVMRGGFDAHVRWIQISETNEYGKCDLRAKIKVFWLWCFNSKVNKINESDKEKRRKNVKWGKCNLPFCVLETAGVWKWWMWGGRVLTALCALCPFPLTKKGFEAILLSFVNQSATWQKDAVVIIY